MKYGTQAPPVVRKKDQLLDEWRNRAMVAEGQIINVKKALDPLPCAGCKKLQQELDDLRKTIGQALHPKPSEEK
jgi:hypothetical protein